MNSKVISVIGLSKRYRIGSRVAKASTLAGTLANWITSPIRNYRRLRDLSRFREDEKGDDIIWALKDVSFDVGQGQVVGLIGQNGSGKSTLLKILSRITYPSAGKAIIRGKVGALLEVGTGFHPEFTGRENVYLNGAVLGMRRAEIDRNFDEIVAFSGVEKFIDTPVKWYSSGMYVRLGFAVAAYMTPTILLIDEVLAVGDAEFQSKCLTKMNDVSQEGRTILFVSHNMGAIKQLCGRTIWLDHGRIRFDGETDDAIGAYLAKSTPSEDGLIPVDAHRSKAFSGEAKFRSVRLLTPEGTQVQQVYLGQPYQVEVILDVEDPISDAVMEIGISTLDGIRFATAYSTDEAQETLKFGEGKQRVLVEMEPTLLPNEYTIDLALHHISGRTIDSVQRATRFSALPMAKDGADRQRWKKVRGYIRPSTHWHAPTSLGDATVAPLEGD
jgi:lipopolysaccharide transport system ATP-binding protein